MDKMFCFLFASEIRFVSVLFPIFLVAFPLCIDVSRDFELALKVIWHAMLSADGCGFSCLLTQNPSVAFLFFLQFMLLKGSERSCLLSFEVQFGPT